MATRSRDDAPAAAATDAAVAGSVANEAARRAGVFVRELETPVDLTAAAELAARVWRTTDTSRMDATLLRALVHTGNFVAGAFGSQAGADLVGMSVGFVTTRPAAGLHSHMTCTSPEWRDRGLGYALKLYQRAWAARGGLTSVTWTYDPLVRRNAYFNLVKLGARAVEYLADFYGPMGDGLNSGDESDRLLTTWPVVAPASRSRPAHPTPPEGYEVVLAVASDGAPIRSDGGGDHVACQIPPDIVSLREQDPRAALRWRHALRDVFIDATKDGYRIDGFTRSGHYLLRRHRPGAAAAGG